ncbi:hypothetical protein PMAC_003306 [Pneumocystis sp. 'macacae']|nr:hypothetical protein PMAC_003306 [Pneumocystis sp. 'macacae']
MIPLKDASQAYSVFMSKKKTLDNRVLELSQFSNGAEKDQLIEETGRQIQDLNDAISSSISLLTSYDSRVLKEQLDKLYISYLSLKKDARPKVNFGFKTHSEVDCNRKEFNKQNTMELGRIRFVFEENKVEKIILIVSMSSNDLVLIQSEMHFLHIKKKIHLYKEYSNNDINISNALLCIYLVHDLGWHSLNVRHFRDSFVLANGISGPAYISDCQNCTFIIFCHQFRMHDSKNINALISCRSKPIIENCTGIRFGPNPYDKDSCKTWNEVQDFGWLKQNKSPNWDIIPEEDRWEVGKWENIIYNTKEVSDVINLICQK